MIAAPANTKLIAYVTASLIKPPSVVDIFINPNGKVSVVVMNKDRQADFPLPVESLEKKLTSHSPQASAWGESARESSNRFNGFLKIREFI
jgi:hypothetical protein